MKTNTKFHVGIHVSDISKSVNFYEHLFNRPPVKVKPDYAKFESDEVVLSLIHHPQKVMPGFGHMGFRVNSDAELQTHHERMRSAGYILDVEENVDCCYAVQNKFWTKDPDGFEWEIYTFIEDTDKSIQPDLKVAENACCGTDCCA